MIGILTLIMLIQYAAASCIHKEFMYLIPIKMTGSMLS